MALWEWALGEGDEGWGEGGVDVDEEGEFVSVGDGGEGGVEQGSEAVGGGVKKDEKGVDKYPTSMATSEVMKRREGTTEILTTREAALLARLHPEVFRRHVRAGRIRVSALNRRVWRFSRRELIADLGRVRRLEGEK